MNYILKDPLAAVQCGRLEPGSDEWQQVRELRYGLFYKMHGLPQTVMDDGLDEIAHHAWIKNDGAVIAYGRATLQADGWLLVTAMVVAVDFQKQGYGRMIMNALIEIGLEEGAKGLSLKSRTTAADFYSRFGFVAQREVFPSMTTGIPHVSMSLRLTP